ncbi:MAG: Flp pilus assembly protein CpaB [Acidobacteriia bacterium]|nr:Flp pilus assembly protein CpaB [Terriglobia bacterium]
MRLDKRFLVVLAISVGWGLLVSAGFYRVARGGGQRAPRKEKAVVMAAQSLDLGAVIKPESVKLVKMPEEAFPKGGFSKVEDVVDRPVISPVLADEPVLEARLATRGSGGGVAPLIPTGMRAISVRVNEVIGVAGFVLPGMHVDVLVTGRPPGRDDTLTTTVLQNIAVLSAGQTLQADAKSQSIKAPVVTLLVTPGQAEILTLADNEGRIQLVLRNSTDHVRADTSGWLVSQLYSQQGRRERPVTAGPQPPRPSASPSVIWPPHPPAPAPHTEPAPASQSAPRGVQLPSDGILVIRGNQKAMETVEIRPGDSK